MGYLLRIAVTGAAATLLAACGAGSLGANAVPQSRGGVGTYESNSGMRGAARQTSPAFSVLYEFDRFTNPSDGSMASGPLISDASGALYGTTQAGGPNGCGNVFKLTPSGSTYTESIIYVFDPGGPPSDPCDGTNDGSSPAWGVYMDSHGALYGTTQYDGSSGHGTIYKLTPSGSSYNETILHNFQGGSDGALSVSGLIADANGALYGTTDGSSLGNGTAFKLAPSGSSYTFSTIATGLYCPIYENLLLDKNGKMLYGEESGCTGTGGNIFELKPSKRNYRFKRLYSFKNLPDGANPYGGLVADKKGVMYGTTWNGGTGTVCGGAGCGTVFSITASGKERVLYSFKGANHSASSPNDAELPQGGATIDSAGNLYGTSNYGGVGGTNQGCLCGTVWELAKSRSGWRESLLHVFDGSDGQDPASRLLLTGGELYGTTWSGAINWGTVFKQTP